MDLRVPGGGSFLFELFDGAGRSAHQGSDAICSDVSPHEVAEGLAQLFHGNIEYVGLNAQVAWIQTADAPGGYVLERSLGDDRVSQFPTVLTPAQVEAAFLAFLAGDVECGLDWSPATLVAEPAQKRRWFRR